MQRIAASSRNSTEQNNNKLTISVTTCHTLLSPVLLGMAVYFMYGLRHSAQGKHGYSRVKDFLLRSLPEEAHADPFKKTISGPSSEHSAHSSPATDDEGFVSPTHRKAFNLKQTVMQPD